MMASAVNPAGVGCGLCANEAVAISRIAPKRNTDIGIDRALRPYLQDDSEVPDSPRFASVAPFSKSPSAKPIATGWSEPVPGRELHPLKSSAFSRRTISPVLQCLPSDPVTRIGTDHPGRIYRNGLP